ncbi:MAG TPA: isochorismatase family protein [Actinocrinis sp.]|jgi:isochorismate hydrolase
MPGIPVIEAYAMPQAAQLPPNRAGWRVEPARAVLLIHDMQEYFLRAFPPAAEPARALMRNAVALREHAVRRGIQVAYTAQPGDMTERDRGLLRDFWGPGMTARPGDRQVTTALAPREGDWLLTKSRYSAFHRTGLLSRMRAAGRDQLIVCGVYAHIGVLTTLNDAFALDIQAFLVADAVADFSAAHHRQAMTYAAECCAVVTSADQILREAS